MSNNKSGSVPDTITWIVATIIIIIMLIVFISVSTLLAEGSSVVRGIKSLFSGESFENADWIAAKTYFAYKINNDNKDFIDDWRSEK